MAVHNSGNNTAPGRPASVHGGVPAHASPLRQPVTLTKGAHTWTFACDPGDEGLLLRRLSELARSEDVPFDWFDAALVSHQLSKRLKAGLYRIDGNQAGTAG